MISVHPRRSMKQDGGFWYGVKQGKVPGDDGVELKINLNKLSESEFPNTRQFGGFLHDTGFQPPPFLLTLKLTHSPTNSIGFVQRTVIGPRDYIPMQRQLSKFCIL